MSRIMRISRPLVAALSVLAFAAPAAHAKAGDYHAAIRDCADDGQLEGHYSRSTLRQALQHLPGDLSEYTDCSDALHAALAAGASGNGSSGGGGGGPTIPSNPSLTTPSGAVAGSQQDLNTLNRETGRSNNGKAPRVTVGGREVTPGDGGVFALARHISPNQLPTSLLLSLIAVAVMSALAGVLVLRHRWPETRRVALRLLRR